MSGARPAPRVCPAHLGVLAGRAFVGGVVTALSTRVQLPFMLSLSVASSLQFLVKNLETEEATLGGRCRAAGRSAWPGRRPAESSRPPPIGTRLPRAVSCPWLPGGPPSSVLLKRSMLSLLCFPGFGSVKLILIP